MTSLTRIRACDHAVRQLPGFACWIVAAVVALALAAPAAAISILKAFPGDPADGVCPYISPVLDGAGNLYGMASYGGATNNGIIFKAKTDGTGYTVLHNFMGGASDGLFPYTGSLILVGADSLYGTTEQGGASGVGTVFTIKTDGTGFALLHSFAADGSEGFLPLGGLVFDGASTFYGTTAYGDGTSNQGTVFTIKTDGTGFAVLHSFAVDGSEGKSCRAPLILDGAGNLYGDTVSGGASGNGTVFKLKTDGTGFTVLHSFASASDGASPWARLVLVGADSLYGTTVQGGALNLGTVFSLKTDGTGFTVLHTFAGGAADGATSRAGLTLAGGALYGVTTVGGASGDGTLFSLKTDGTGFALLHSFAGGASDGVTPRAAPTFDGADTLYGPTMNGGASNDGTIFKIKTDGTGLTIVHAFAWAPPDGTSPSALVLDGSGNLYGTTYNGGPSNDGTVFTIKTDGTGFALLRSFAGASDGANPSGSLILDGAGNLYGTTSQGGASGYGTVFTLTTGGTGFTLLHSFAGGTADAATPNGPLVLDGAGTLYGTSSGGGTSNVGTVFKITTGGTGFALLHSFAADGSDGASPNSSLILDGAGNLYGTTAGGGASGYGTVFTLTTGGTGFTTLHSFASNPNGVNPNPGLVLDSAGNLYGTTWFDGASNAGTVFTLKTDGTGFNVLHNFSWAASDGANPEASLILNAGNLYSTTEQGGASGNGTVFTLTTGGTGFALLHSFAGGASDGANPWTSLILAAGNLYGTTGGGGAWMLGTVFSLPVTGDQAPAITSLSATTFAIGSFNSFTVTTAGYPTPSISLTGALPSGVSFTDNGNGTATLAGTPATGTGDTYPLGITAHNGIGSDATQSFTLTVQNCSCYTLSTATSPGGVGSVTVNTAPNCGGNYISGTGISLTANVPSGYMFAGWSGSGGTFSSSSAVRTTFTITGTASVTATFTKGSKYYPLTPCRVVDTRSSIDPATVKRGTFTNGEIRAYTFSTSTECPGLSSTAKAWVIHLSFQPLSQASYLTVYPDGATRPLASTILGYPNKWIGDNAVISAGSGGTIDLYSQYAANVIIDVNGYFK